jgi:hypothetical protein
MSHSSSRFRTIAIFLAAAGAIAAQAPSGQAQSIATGACSVAPPTPEGHTVLKVKNVYRNKAEVIISGLLPATARGLQVNRIGVELATCHRK